MLPLSIDFTNRTVDIFFDYFSHVYYIIGVLATADVLHINYSVIALLHSLCTQSLCFQNQQSNILQETVCNLTVIQRILDSLDVF